MTKLEAIRNVAQAWASMKNTKTAGTRLVRSLRVLGLDDDEVLEVLIDTAYANANGIVMDGVKFDRADSREAPAS